MRTPPRRVGALLAAGVIAATFVPVPAMAQHHHAGRPRKGRPPAETPAPSPPQGPAAPGEPSAVPLVPVPTAVTDGAPVAPAILLDEDLGAPAATEVLSAFGAALASTERLRFHDAAELLDRPAEA